MIHTVCARDVSGMAQGEVTTFLEIVDAEREHVAMTTKLGQKPVAIPNRKLA